MAVDHALIEAMEKIRDAMLDFEVAADKAGMSPDEASMPQGGEHLEHAAAPHDEGGDMDMPPEVADPSEADEPEEKPAFTALGSYRFGGGSPKVKGPPVDERPQRAQGRRR